MNQYPKYLVLAIALLMLVVSAGATNVLLGSSNGLMGVYYNDNDYGEMSVNQAYLQAHYSETNLGNGALFNFNPYLTSGAPGYGTDHLFQAVPDQFGLDMVIEAPTSDGSRTIPTLGAYDNTDYTVANRHYAGDVIWSLGDYKDDGGPTGPGNPNADIINSLFRGNGVDLAYDLSVSGTVFTMDISGYLLSDGLIHWYYGGSTNLFDWGFQNRIYFEGSFSYDSFGESPTNLVDYYQGGADLYLVPVPEPATLSLILVAAFGGLALRRRRNRRHS